MSVLRREKVLLYKLMSCLVARTVARGTGVIENHYFRRFHSFLPRECMVDSLSKSNKYGLTFQRFHPSLYQNDGSSKLTKKEHVPSTKWSTELWVYGNYFIHLSNINISSPLLNLTQFLHAHPVADHYPRVTELKFSHQSNHQSKSHPLIDGVENLERLLPVRSPSTSPDSLSLPDVLRYGEKVGEEHPTPSPQTQDDTTRGLDPSHQDLPTEEQLQRVFENLEKTLPNFFKSKMNMEFWHYHSRDIEFIDNIRGSSARGLSRYMFCSLWIRFLVHMKFGYMRFEILKMTQHADEGTIKVRWSIRGLPGWRLFYNFYKFKIWKPEHRWADNEEWYDGFSTFYIDSDGNIFRHVADSVMPDDDRAIRKPSILQRLGLRLGGVTAGPSKLFKSRGT